MSTSIRMAALAAALSASVITATRAETYTWIDFHDADGLSLNGDAKITGDHLRLTQSRPNQSGSLFTAFGVAANGFHTAFTFRIDQSHGNQGDEEDGDQDADAQGCAGQTGGGEGLAFVLQGARPDSIGEDGGGLGYEGIPDSFAVEFDTHCNPALGDRTSNEISLVAGGVVLASTAVDRPMDNGNRRYAWLDYDGSQLEVRLSNVDERPDRPDLIYGADIPAMVGGSICCAGFTASTGAVAVARHLVYDWRYVEANTRDLPTGRGASQTAALVHPVCRNRVGTSRFGQAPQ